MRLGVTRMVLLGGALSCALVAPAGASAATAAVDRACYPGDGSGVVSITGSGFTPDGEVQLQIGGGIVGVTAADASGNVSTTFPVPAPPESGPSKDEKAYELALVQGAVRATTTIRSARVVADFRPTTGRPSTLKVRFSAFGFGVATPSGQPMPAVYVHYVDPRGKVRRTISLGAGTSPCGTIRRTALRRLFPFNPRRGTWTLQVDTSPAYRRGTGVSRFVFDRVALTIS